MANGHVREAIRRDLGEPAGPGARYTVRHGEATHVELDARLDPKRFRAGVEEGMQRAADSETSWIRDRRPKFHRKSSAPAL